MTSLLFVISVLAAIFLSLFLELSRKQGCLFVGVTLILVTQLFPPSFWTFVMVNCAVGLGLLLLWPDSFRQRRIIAPLLQTLKNNLRALSETETIALKAGSVSIEGDFFKGQVDWEHWLHLPQSTLSAEEEAFLEGPCEALCEMLNDWQDTHYRYDVSPEVWEFLKKNGFFSLIIPKTYGGLEFSAIAQSAILQKIATKSLLAASIVAVPNTLGPGELIQHYGTQKQKDYYLPRLAKGLEIPCFALTGPYAGSDATAIPDIGVVEYGLWEGQKTLGITLNFSKRYITLAPVATLIGLAFTLQDPQQLLGSEANLGITCALLPANTKGVEIGLRHFPLNVPFPNGPIVGQNVFIPLDFIIGGTSGIGQGWKMLVECLSAGRGIALPGTSVGISKIGTLTTSAYTRIRRQFRNALADFEGIKLPLAEMAGTTYLLEASLQFLLSRFDAKEAPAVLSAIAKCYSTELGRKLSAIVMDLHGGKGIMLGPHNYLARYYQGACIGVTVEGANILTRNLIIFGQGAVRCHPFILKEIEAIQKGDVPALDKLLLSHIALVGANIGRSLFYKLFFWLPHKRARNLPAALHSLTRLCLQFSLVSEACFLQYGAKLKFKEAIGGRLADLLAYLYFTFTIVYRHQHEKHPEDHTVLFHWALDFAIAKYWEAYQQLLPNLPWHLRCLLKICAPWHTQPVWPSDTASFELAETLTRVGPLRKQFMPYLHPNSTHPWKKLEHTLALFEELEPVFKKIQKAFPEMQEGQWLAACDQFHMLSEAERTTLKQALTLQAEICAVDAFSLAELQKGH